MAVQDELLVDQADVVARKADGALHVILFDVQRITEDDDIAAADLAIGQQILEMPPAGA